MNSEEIMKNYWLTHKEESKAFTLEEHTERMHLDYRVDKELAEKWHPFLKYIQDSHAAREMTLFLENQRLYNEGHIEVKKEYEKEIDVFKRMSLPLVQIMFDPANFIGWDIVNIQGMLSPAGMVTYKKYKTNENYDKTKEITDDNLPTLIVPEKEDILAKTRRLKTSFPYQEHEGVLKTLGEAIANEMNREILTDLRNNAGTIMKREIQSIPNKKYSKSDGIYCNVLEMSGVLHRKTLATTRKWIVTSPKIGSILLNDESILDRKSTHITREGTLWSAYKLFIDPLSPQGHILTGCKDEQNDTPWGAYFYCPYIPLSCMFGDHGNSLLARYSKKLKKEGAKFYGRIEVLGLDE